MLLLKDIRDSEQRKQLFCDYKVGLSSSSMDITYTLTLAWSIEKRKVEPVSVKMKHLQKLIHTKKPVTFFADQNFVPNPTKFQCMSTETLSITYDLFNKSSHSLQWKDNLEFSEK